MVGPREDSYVVNLLAGVRSAGGDNVPARAINGTDHLGPRLFWLKERGYLTYDRHRRTWV